MFQIQSTELLIIVLVVVAALLIFQMSIIFVMKNNMKHLQNDLREQKDFFVEKIFQNEQKSQKELFAFRVDLEKGLKADFERLTYSLDRRVLHLQNQVDQKLDQNLEQTTKTFQHVLERLHRIDYAQKKLDDLSTNINSLEHILNDKTARGAFGEIQLEHIFEAVFGDNPTIYKKQYTLPNNAKVDLMLFGPEQIGNIAIDSKFPLENYRRIVDTTGKEQEAAKRQFRLDMKRHIDDIASKYIIEGVTAEYAILFLPAESVFSYIQAYCQDIVTYGYEKRVWLASPTTLMALLTTLQAVLRNMERDKYATVIRDELQLLGKEFVRYQDRWQSLVRRIEQVSKDVQDVNITSEKITKRFKELDNAQLSPEEQATAFINEMKE